MTKTEDRFSWVHARGPRVVVRGDGVPEGIAYPERDGVSSFDAEWRAEAVAAGRRSWAVIGGRPAWIVVHGSTGVKHALRDAPRGYGKRRHQWQTTTQCGQILSDIAAPVGTPTGLLRDTTCLSCRRVVREWFEFQVQRGEGADDLLNTYEELIEFWQEQSWRVQAEWHRPDPAPLWNVPPDLTYSLLGG